MSGLSQEKMKILELLWKKGFPLDLREIARETEFKVRSANMHLLGLKKAGYISLSEKGYHVLTDLGKEALGFPKVDSELAKKILDKTSMEKAFHFYIGIGQSLGISSNSLVDFCEKISSIDFKSIEFHLSRGDFELWVHYLGDVELAKRLRLIRETRLCGETLRDEVYTVVKSRCDKLQELSSY